MNDAHVAYARFRTVLELDKREAARRSGLTVEQANKLETSTKWPRLRDEARDIEGLRLAARDALFDTVVGDNEGVPEHTRVKIIQWALARIDEDFMSPEFRDAQRGESDQNPLENLSDEELRKHADDSEEKVVLDESIESGEG